MGEQVSPDAVRPRYRKLTLAALPVTVVLALTACGPGGTAPGAGGPPRATDGVGLAAPPSGRPADALAKWRSFPVSADPRPLVLTQGMVIDPATGFGTDEDKIAYIAGAVEFTTTPPAAPASSGGYTILSAQAVLGRLRPTGKSEPASRPLRIVKASLVQAAFGTDRGPRPLPAWRFDLDGVSEPVMVLAIDSKHLWHSPGQDQAGVDQQATVGTDDRSVTFTFYGSPPGPPPCGADYTAEVAESRTAVVVTPRQTSASTQGTPSNVACPAIAARRTVTARLAAPLGGRVLLTAEGAPIPVTSR